MSEVEFRPFIDCFELDDNIRACHLLWEDYKKERTDLVGRSGMHKAIFYNLLIKNEHGAKRGKDDNGNMGFGLRYIEKTK